MSPQAQSSGSRVASGTLASYSAIDAIGNRISSGLSSQAYLAVDLHGNVAAAVNGNDYPVFLAAFRYDAAGQTVDAYTAGGAPEIPYRYQGRILQSASGSTDLYDFGARSYDPSLGVFISFDTVSGSAQNPLTLNRYLYALGNPASMIDPDGHCAWNANTHKLEGSDCGTLADGTPASRYQDVLDRHERMLAAKQQAIKQGCPVGYCGTDEEKKSWFDSAVEAAQLRPPQLNPTPVDDDPPVSCGHGYCGAPPKASSPGGRSGSQSQLGGLTRTATTIQIGTKSSSRYRRKAWK